MQAACPDGHWWQFLPDILAGLRQLPSRSGYSAHTLVYKQDPVYPHLGNVHAERELAWPTVEQEQELLQQQLRWWDSAVAQVRQRLSARDVQMKDEYSKRPDLAAMDVRYAFTPGSLVIMKQKRPGKLLTKATGPYKFVQYNGSHNVTATVEDAAGR